MPYLLAITVASDRCTTVVRANAWRVVYVKEANARNQLRLGYDSAVVVKEYSADPLS